MKKLNCLKSKLAPLALLLALCSCEGTFVPDPLDPRLPYFTEDGNNVAGAYIDDDVWKSVVSVGFPSVYDAPYIESWPEKDSLVVHFLGNIGDSSASLSFHLNRQIAGFQTLQLLDGQKIQLDGVENVAHLQTFAASGHFSPSGFGQIYFSKAELDESTGKIILAGTFGFVEERGDAEILVRSGRFDYRLNANTSFYLE